MKELQEAATESEKPAAQPLPYLNACITEVLRLTSASISPRFALTDTSLTLSGRENSYAIRKDDGILLLSHTTHYDPEIYEDPMAFKPERHLSVSDGGVETVFKKNGKVVHNNILAFGGGSSLCPGRYLARSEVSRLHFLILFLL
jgi:cytochrome P450